MTELHRSGFTRSLALKGGGVGVGLLALAALGAVLGGPMGGYLAVLCGVVGGFLVLVAALLFVLSLRPFHVRFSESGLSVNNGDGLRFDVSWDQVEAINIERMPTADERYMFAVWLDPSIVMKYPPHFPPGAAVKGYGIVELEDLTESREELSAILNRYAGEKFRSGAFQS